MTGDQPEGTPQPQPGYPPPQPEVPPQPVYYQPPPGYVVVQQSRGTNGFSVASLVLGILWLYWIGSVLALIFGYVAKGQIDRSGGTQGGRGMAIAGIVLGWVGVGVLLLLFVIGVGVGLSGF